MANKRALISQEKIAEVSGWIRKEIEPIQGLVTTLLEVDSYDAGDDVANLVVLAAERWAKILLDENDENAGTVGQSIVRLSSVGRVVARVLSGHAPRAEDDTSLWGTRLGQMIFKRGGFPQRPATRMEAAAILNVTRQAVEYMARRHYLHSEGTLIVRDSLVREWQRRTAEDVIASDRASELPSIPEGNPDDTGEIRR